MINCRISINFSPVMPQHSLFRGYLDDNEVSLVRGGKEYFSLLLEMIGEATRFFHIQVYILEDDHTGGEVVKALKEAAYRGVKVYILADGYASQSLSSDFVAGLRSAGIQFKFFEPLFRSRSFYFGRRLHHKVAVMDDERALVGGINISDKYNDLGGRKAWLDFAIHARGRIAGELGILCSKTWNGFSVPAELYRPLQPDLSAISSPVPVRMRRNDWVRRKNQISATYFQILRSAEKEIIILSSYFIPGRAIRRNISSAVKRGVKVKLILAGLSDVKLAKNAERFMYDWLLRRNIEIYEYNRNILHGKLAVCDDSWLTLGSYNVNDISAYASIELNLDIRSPLLAAELKGKLEGIMKDDCIRVTVDPGQRYNRGWWRQFKCWLSYRIFRLTLYLFTFYFKQQG